MCWKRDINKIWTAWERMKGGKEQKLLNNFGSALFRWQCLLAQIYIRQKSAQQQQITSFINISTIAYYGICAFPTSLLSWTRASHNGCSIAANYIVMAEPNNSPFIFSKLSFCLFQSANKGVGVVMQCIHFENSQEQKMGNIYNIHMKIIQK